MATQADRDRPEAVELRTKLAALELRRFGPGDHHRELFNAYDADHDGACSPRELRALLTDAGIGNALTRGMWVSGLLAHLDRDGSDSVTFEEFETAVATGTPAAPPARAPTPPRAAPPPPRPPPIHVPPRSSSEPGHSGNQGALVALALVVALFVVGLRRAR